jgi:hypothetical protein
VSRKALFAAWLSLWLSGWVFTGLCFCQLDVTYGQVPSGVPLAMCWLCLGLSCTTTASVALDAMTRSNKE